MRVDMPNIVEVTLEYDNRFEECFIIGALSTSELYNDFVIDVVGHCVMVSVDIDDIDGFRLFLDDLEENLARFSERFIDYTN